MSSRSNIFFVILLYFTGKVILCNCEVVSVKRNVVDSFFVGKNGCATNTSICTMRFAKCESDGWCLCSSLKPTYRNPVITVNSGKFANGVSDGCVNNQYIQFGDDNGVCRFSPFDVIPYSKNEPATKFSHVVPVRDCFFENASAKFPDKAAEIKPQWLSESYMEINSTGNELHFKWKISVPQLQGAIATFSFQCDLGAGHVRNCLRTKVLGTWSATPLTCSEANLREMRQTRTTCGNVSLFITALHRHDPFQYYHLSYDPISLLNKARCCSAEPVFNGEESECKWNKWTVAFDRNEQWAFCDQGYFLNGLYCSMGTELSAIDEGHCCRPKTHPDRYGLCYDEDVGESFNEEGWSGCSRPGYYITGIYRGNGSWLNNIDKFKCCQMAAAQTAPTVIYTQPRTTAEISGSTEPTVGATEKLIEENSNTWNVIYWASLAGAVGVIVVLGIVVVLLCKKIHRMHKKIRERGNIVEQQTTSLARDDAPYESIRRNSGTRHNEAFVLNVSSTADYEDVSNYESLQRTQSDMDENRYQRLTTTVKKNELKFNSSR